MGFIAGLRKPEKVYLQKAMEGLDTNRKDLDIAYHGDIVQNGRFGDEHGSVTKRNALSVYNSSVETNPIKSAYRYYNESASTAYLIQLNGAALRVGTGTAGSFSALTTPNTLQSTSTRFTAVTYQDLCYISTGYDDIIITDGTAAWELGACKATLASGGSNLDSAAIYYYAIGYNTDVDGDSGSNIITGAISNKITTDASNRKIDLSNIPLGPSGALSRMIFRTDGGGSTLKKHHILADNTTTTWTDDLADGGDAPDNDTMDTVTDDQPKGKFLYIAQERLFVTGDPTYPSTVYYSDQYLPATIQTSVADLSAAPAVDYYEVISEDDNDFITGMVAQLGVTYIFKQNSIRPFYIKGTPNEWTLGDVVSPIGSPAPYSILPTPWGIVYQGYRHMYLFNGQYSSPIIDTFNVSENILDSRRDESYGFFWNNQYLMAYTDANDGKGYHDRVLVYDMIRKQLSLDKGGPLASGTANINCFTAFRGSTEWGQLYAGDSNLGWIYTYDRTLNSTILNTVSGIDGGSHSSTMAVGRENNPIITKYILDNMETYTTDTQARDAWATSETTEKIPPDLGTGADGARTLGGTGSITAFADAGGQITVTSASHSLAEGDEVVITVTTNYDGTFTATNVTTNTFEITATWVADDATGTWTGGDVTLAAGTYNYTSLTVAADKVLTITGNTTIKVQGDVSNSGVIAGGSSLNIYAVNVTNESSDANIINTAIHIRANTIDNQGTITDDPIQASTVTVPTGTEGDGDGYGNQYLVFWKGAFATQTDVPSGDIDGTSAYTYDEDYDTKYGADRSSEGGTAIRTTLDFGFVVDIVKVKKQAYGVHGGSGKDGAKTWLYYNNQWNIILEEIPGRDVNMDTSAVEIEGLWTGVSKIRVEAQGTHYGISSHLNSAYIHEVEVLGTDPVYDYINDTQTNLPDADDITDFVNALECYSEASTINQGDYALKVQCANGAIALDEYFLKTISEINIGASTHDSILIDVYASRSGTQFQLGISETTAIGNHILVNVPVTAANTWETVTLDFSGVDATKDAIIELALKFTNTDAFNTVYIDNIRTGYYADSTYTSPVVEINAGSMGSMFWGEDKNNNSGTYTNDVVFHTRTGAYLDSAGTAPSDTDGGTAVSYHATTLSNPIGSAIGSTAAKYFQFKVVFSSNDTTGTYYPYLLMSGIDGYVIKASYYKVATAAETAVEFRFRTGWRNYEMAFEDKVFKKITSLHEGDTGSFDLIVEADMADTQTYTFSGIDLTSYPKRWISNFPATIYGKELRLEWYKSDTNEFKVKQFGIVIEPQPLI